jgi:hypothetical protein
VCATGTYNSHWQLKQGQLLTLESLSNELKSMHLRPSVSELGRRPYLLARLGMHSERKQIPQVVENIEKRRNAIERLEGEIAGEFQIGCLNHATNPQSAI